MWDNVSNFFQGYGADPNIRLALTKTITKQLIDGLTFMEKCGVIHNGINFSLHLWLDFHPRNFLLAFKSSEMTVNELLEREHSAGIVPDSSKAYVDYSLGGETKRYVRIYQSQPLCLLSEGDLCAFEQLAVKISDFGKGLSTSCLT
jgi:serine/threonine protein kinase